MWRPTPKEAKASKPIKPSRLRPACACGPPYCEGFLTLNFLRFNSCTQFKREGNIGETEYAYEKKNGKKKKRSGTQEYQVLGGLVRNILGEKRGGYIIRKGKG